MVLGPDGSRSCWPLYGRRMVASPQLLKLSGLDSVALNAREIGLAVAGLTDGAYIDEFFLADDKIDMYVPTAKCLNER